MRAAKLGHDSGSKRQDLQGLRTLAVGLVVFYHLYPGQLPGGFIGVDVFFVISGYLIVGSLVREVVRSGRINLMAFYARRIRRLLPAATADLLATMVATLMLLPQSRWQDVARDVIASALQVQNWNQAFSSVSYEAAGQLVSPVQHYWSLAVEEQFYLVIPLLLLAASVCALRFKRNVKAACLLLLCVVSAASLVHSVIFSLTDHGIAYFATTTRMWEMGLGGIAALTLGKVRLGAATRFALGWAGVAAVVFSAITYSTVMAFPGYIALLPVLGALLIIAAGSRPAGELAKPSPLAASAFLGLRPVVYLGDISYSLYLWHWPVVVFYVLTAGHQPGLLGGAAIVLLSLVLAVGSYHFIEQQFRFAKTSKPADARHYKAVPRHGAAYIMAACLVGASCIAAAVPWQVVQEKTDNLNAAVTSPDYPGAMAFDPIHPARVPAGQAILPDPAVATKDVPLTSKDGCITFNPATMLPNDCTYGDRSAHRSVVLIGDSHAAQYIDPLDAAGAKTGWKVRAMVRNGCPFSSVPPASATVVYTVCSNQNKVSLQKILSMKPDKVVIVGMAPAGYRKALGWGWKSNAALMDGYVAMIRPLREAGIAVSVIADNPYPAFSVPDCVEQNGPASAKCQVKFNAGTSASLPLSEAAGQVPGTNVVDLYEYLCKDGSCPPVIGNVLVYRDNHMTATFARTLAVPLEKDLNL